MAGGKIELQAPPEVLALLPGVIEVWADAAHPPGGSPCSQAAREALLELARSLQSELESGVTVLHCPRRMRASLRQAIDWQRAQTDDAEQRDRLDRLHRTLDGGAQ
ncbi:MAG TPA: hypothetical protein ENK00_01440 [Chromatiales bacterium]|nr:hypothetical protein [Chromatiales bacterium]